MPKHAYDLPVLADFDVFLHHSHLFLSECFLRSSHRVLLTILFKQQRLSLAAFMDYHHEEEGVAAGVEKQAWNEACFCKVMNKTHVGYSVGMTIPKEFSRKYKRHLVGGILLQESTGSRTWALGVLRKSGSYHLTRGWSRFVSENKIAMGDILIFRLIKGNSFSFEVYGADDGLEKSVDHASAEGFNVKHNSKSMHKSSDSDSDSGSNSDEPPALPKHRKDSPMTFEVLVKHSPHWLYIAAAYRDCLPKNNEVILLIDSNKREWPVNWFASPRRMTGGWTAFVHHHKIDAGDSLLFERQSKKSFKVTKIIRGAATAAESESDFSEAGSKSFTSQDM